MNNRVKRKMSGRELRKVCIKVAMVTKTNLPYYLQMPLSELAELIQDLQEVQKG